MTADLSGGLRRLGLTAACCASVIAAPALALAQGQCTPVDPITAEVNSRQGVEMAQQGDYEGALALFRVATKLDACEPEYPLLQARALERAGRRQEAVAMYSQVLQSFPGTGAAREADEARKALLAAPEPAPPKVPVVKQPEEKPLDWALMGYIGTGVGVLLAGGGVLFALDAQGADDDIPEAIADNDQARYDDLVSQRDSSSTLSYVFYGLGGALIVGGVAAILLAPDEPASPKISVIPDPRGGAHFGWTLHF